MEYTNFRLARMHNYRRIFCNTSKFLLDNGIANVATKEISGLCTEPCPNSSFIISVFDIPPSLEAAFREREKGYHIISATFTEQDGSTHTGLMCTRSTDAAYIESFGRADLDALKQYGVHSIWDYAPNSGILPVPVYLRHCILTVQDLGQVGMHTR